MKSDDNVPIAVAAYKLAEQNAGKVVAYWRFGTVIAWDALAGTSQIQVGNTVLENLPSLAGFGAMLLDPGDTAIIGVAGTSMTVLGSVRSGANYHFPIMGTPFGLGYGVIDQWPTFTSSTYTELCYAFPDPSTPFFRAWVGTSVPVGVTAQFRTLVDGAQVDESTVFVGGSGQYVTLTPWPAGIQPGSDAGRVSIEGKRISGTAAVSFSPVGIFPVGANA